MLYHLDALLLWWSHLQTVKK